MKDKAIDEKIIQLRKIIKENLANKKRSFEKDIKHRGDSINFFDTIGEQFYNFYKDSFAILKSPFTGEKSPLTRFLSALGAIPLGILGLLFITATIIAPLLLALEGVFFLGRKAAASSNIKYAKEKIKKLENMKSENKSNENQDLPSLESGKEKNQVNIKTKDNVKKQTRSK